jgi:hypothetical protein
VLLKFFGDREQSRMGAETDRAGNKRMEKIACRGTLYVLPYINMIVIKSRRSLWVE